MENFNQIFTLVAETKTIHLNSDVLESGVINILILVAILIYLGRDFLGGALEERQEQIIQAVQDAEEKLTAANIRLTEAEKQLTQAQVIISEIQKETVNTKKNLLESDSSEIDQELSIRFNRAFVTLNSREQVVFTEIKQQIIRLTLKQVISKIQSKLGSTTKSRLIDNNIAQLGGNL